jgi:hypothetical protein
LIRSKRHIKACSKASASASNVFEQVQESRRFPDPKEAREVSARRSRHASGSALTLPTRRANLGWILG